MIVFLVALIISHLTVPLLLCLLADIKNWKYICSFFKDKTSIHEMLWTKLRHLTTNWSNISQRPLDADPLLSVGGPFLPDFATVVWFLWSCNSFVKELQWSQWGPCNLTCLEQSGFFHCQGLCSWCGHCLWSSRCWDPWWKWTTLPSKCLDSPEIKILKRFEKIAYTFPNLVAKMAIRTLLKLKRY